MGSIGDNFEYRLCGTGDHDYGSDQRWMVPGFARSLSYSERLAAEAGKLTPQDITAPLGDAVILHPVDPTTEPGSVEGQASSPSQ